MNNSRIGFLGISHGWWVVICVIYTLLPIDLASAWFFGPLGIVDNFGVVGFGFYSFIRWLSARSPQQRVAPDHRAAYAASTSPRAIDTQPAQSAPSLATPLHNASGHVAQVSTAARVIGAEFVELGYRADTAGDPRVGATTPTMRGGAQ